MLIHSHFPLFLLFFFLVYSSLATSIALTSFLSFLGQVSSQFPFILLQVSFHTWILGVCAKIMIIIK